MDKELIVIHDFNGRSYYKALDHLYHVKYIHSKPFTYLLRDLLRSKRISKDTLASLIFFLKLPFVSGEKVILAMAPFNFRIIFYSFLAKKNKIYYHTSWPYWKGNKQPFNYNKPFNYFLKLFWIYFLKNKPHKIIAVTKNVKLELIRFTGIKEIHQIYHTVDLENKPILKIEERKNNLLYIGRLTPEKGVMEAIDILNSIPKTLDFRLQVLGSGKLENVVREISKNNPKLNYYGFLSGDKKREVASQCKFLLLPSKKTDRWEELFGIVIIEAMKLGIIPLVTDNIGPKEIVKNNETGFVFTEENFVSGSTKIIQTLKPEKINLLSNNCVLEAEKFSICNISNQWKKVLE
jgi:glycosyltransferase involved in cell wall biosynthesis